MDNHRSEAEAKMRQSLGLSDGSRLLVPEDPQRLARQAIRSQAAAREYAERQLVRAEQTIQDLRTKFHAVRHEKVAAVEAARTAHAARAQAERGLRAVETALIDEKAISGCAQREAQKAQATVLDLRTKLALANQTAEALQTQLAQERQARISAEPEPSTVQVPAAVGEIENAAGDQPVKRKRGRPPGKRDPSTSPRPTQKAARKPYADNQQPVQWWTDGWTPIA